MPTFVMRNGRLVDKATGEPLETEAAPIGGFFITPDIPAFQSPITGEWIDGRTARREHMKQHGVVECGDSPSQPREFQSAKWAAQYGRKDR